MSTKQNFHENYRQTGEIKGGSNRAFGIVFCVVFGIIAAWPMVFSGGPPRWWALGISLAILGLALVYPRSLALPNRLWTKLGLLLHKVVNPIIMGLIFFLAFTPMALLLRLLGKDLLSLKHKAEAESHWVLRDPPGPSPESMRRQY